MSKTLAREIVQTCLESCKAYDLPSDDYVRVVRSITETLERFRTTIHAEVADYLTEEAKAIEVGLKGKEGQLLQVALEGMANAVRKRTGEG